MGGVSVEPYEVQECQTVIKFREVTDTEETFTSSGIDGVVGPEMQLADYLPPPGFTWPVGTPGVVIPGPGTSIPPAPVPIPAGGILLAGVICMVIAWRFVYAATR